MLEMLETFLRPAFAISAIIYVGLAIHVSRSSPQYANNIIAFFLALVGVLVSGTAFSYGTTDPTIYGIGRVLTFSASGFLPIAFYVVYREYTVGPPRAILIAILSVIPIATTAAGNTTRSRPTQFFDR